MRLHFLLRDNPSLSKKTLEQYRSRFAGIFYDWYVRGLWVAPTGFVYPNFSEREHATDQAPWLSVEQRVVGTERSAFCKFCR